MTTPPDQMEFFFTAEMPETKKATPAAKPVEKSQLAPPKNLVPAPSHSSKETMLAKAKQLRLDLEKRTGFRFRLTINDNTSTIISTRGERFGVRKINLHHMFLDAPTEVRYALADWIKDSKNKLAGDTVNRFMRESKHKIRQKPPRRIRLNPFGKVHNLKEMYAEVNAESFNNTITSKIGWGKMPAKMPRRSIRFGSYDHERDCIRIHPLLDQDYVPRYYVKFVVFHEMLHADMGIAESESGRRSMHPPEFRKREKLYSEYVRAIAWEKDRTNMSRIFNSRKRAKK